MSTGDHAVIQTAGDAPDLVVRHDGEYCPPVDQGEDDEIADAGWVAVTSEIDGERYRVVLTYFENKLVNPPELTANGNTVELEKDDHYDGPGVAYRIPDRYKQSAEFVIARAEDVA